MPRENALVRELSSPAPERPAGAAGGALRDLAVALSLANLCYLRVWSELLTYRRNDTYLMSRLPGPPGLAAVMSQRSV